MQPSKKKKSFTISSATRKESSKEPIPISKRQEEIPVEDMIELKEKKKLMMSLLECDKRIQIFEASIFNLHNGKVQTSYFVYMPDRIW